AQNKDLEKIPKILEEADLHYPGEVLNDFWVAEKDKDIIGVVRLEENKDFFFLTSLGVAKENRNQGVAAALLKTILEKANKNVYLYTIIPDFFKKLGFELTEKPVNLPSKELFGCRDCAPSKCVCMVRCPHAS
ncbi:MAG: GNAT family N-acetyltransferase, partial [Candidatus Saganbacteria bacterium]|nr:GNAT family N-acetyltransferase [Candidatus Saganbacteria bacterium]